METGGLNRHEKGGRPRLGEGEKRKDLKIYLTPSELAEFEMRAREFGMPAARYIRLAALDRQLAVVPAINRERYTELARLAGNLNQLARAVNSGQLPGVPPALLPQVVRLVQALRVELLGEASGLPAPKPAQRGVA